MYYMTLQVTSDTETALLRLDLDYTEAEKVLHLELTDSNGTRHSWEHSYRFEGSWQDFGRTALEKYLQDTVSKGWRGHIRLVHLAVGLDPDEIVRDISGFLWFNAIEKPQEMALQ